MLHSTRYACALTFAAKAHDGQVRRGTPIPYITHPLAVSGLVVEFGGDEDQAIAGLLHDVVEDCAVPLRTISAKFGSRVAAIVGDCTDGLPGTDGLKGPWLERKTAFLQRLEEKPQDTLLVCACDKLHNARAIVADIERIGHLVFERFSATRAQTLWYYQSLAATFRSRLEQPDLARAVTLEVHKMGDQATGA